MLALLQEALAYIQTQHTELKELTNINSLKQSKYEDICKRISDLIIQTLQEQVCETITKNLAEISGFKKSNKSSNFSRNKNMEPHGPPVALVEIMDERIDSSPSPSYSSDNPDPIEEINKENQSNSDASAEVFEQQAEIEEFIDSENINQDHAFPEEELTIVKQEIEIPIDNFDVGNHTISGRIVYQCDQCPKSYLRKNNFRMHQRIHQGTAPYKCRFCGKFSLRRQQLREHEMTHTGEKPIECDICHKKFIKKSQLISHKRTHTGEKPFECKYCGKKFRERLTQKMHERVHTGEKPFQCDICGKEFRRAQYLKEHYPSHNEEKSFQCEICAKKFSLATTLRNHIQICTMKLNPSLENKFPCDVCGKEFLLERYLTQHKRIHAGEKPFHCKICDKSFLRKQGLESHLMVHTGEKPFECTKCQKKFGAKSSLNKHIRKCHLPSPVAET